VKIKSFDSLQSLGERFQGEVFKDISENMFYVYDRMSNMWYRYRWAPGKREIAYVGEHTGELPLVTQVYPEI
jgi:hypothetical protein